VPAPLVSLADVHDAVARVGPILRSTPVSSIDSVNRICGLDVRLKEEQRQRTGSFKIRGAYNRISRLAAGTEVVAASAGNHAQGVALAAALCHCSSSIFMPVTASLPKLEATKGYGASVHLVDGSVEDAVDAAKLLAAERGAVFVPPFDDRLVIAGQGTLAVELVDQVPDAATIVVPVGGGGLIAGIAAAYAELAPATRVVGVEATGAAAMRASLDAGEIRSLTSLTTIADGIAVKAPSPLTLAHARAFVDDIVTVTDEQIAEALLVLLERAKVVVEPSGAAGFAAVLAGAVRSSGPIVVVLSGGNVDSLLLSRLIEHGLSVSGRYLRLRIEIPDRPGTLAAVASVLAELGLNVLDVEHHREGLSALDVQEVELAVIVETRGAEHRDACLRALRERGWTVRAE
jgi:threonine dehydratase